MTPVFTVSLHSLETSNPAVKNEGMLESWMLEWLWQASFRSEGRETVCVWSTSLWVQTVSPPSSAEYLFYLPSLCWFVSPDSSCAHPSTCTPSSSPLSFSRRPPFPPSPAVLWDVMMLWQAWRLFLEVLVFLWPSSGGWYRNSGGVVVYSVGGSGDAVMVWELRDFWSHCIDRRETREDCVSWLPGCKFSPGLLTHKFDEQCYLSRQSRGILRRECVLSWDVGRIYRAYLFTSREDRWWIIWDAKSDICIYKAAAPLPPLHSPHPVAAIHLIDATCSRPWWLKTRDTSPKTPFYDLQAMFLWQE